MEKKKKKQGFYPENYKLNLKDLPPILDPYITPSTFPQVVYNEKPNWPKEKMEMVSGELLEVEDDASFCCTTKHVDPNSTNRFDKKSGEICGDIIGDLQSTTISKDQGNKNKVSAKAQLHEVCAANHWKPPLFECCKEEGPCHMRLFTYKVTFVMESWNTILECFGAPKTMKKTAAEDAAEAAMWYLKFLGYFPIPKMKHMTELTKLQTLT